MTEVGFLIQGREHIGGAPGLHPIGCVGSNETYFEVRNQALRGAVGRLPARATLCRPLEPVP